MIPGRFEYHAPSSLDEVISLLAEHEDARVIAGGHSLLPMMKLRFAEPVHLVDINGHSQRQGCKSGRALDDPGRRPDSQPVKPADVVEALKRVRWYEQ